MEFYVAWAWVWRVCSAATLFTTEGLTRFVKAGAVKVIS
jgi:hypothetical protein